MYVYTERALSIYRRLNLWVKYIVNNSHYSTIFFNIAPVLCSGYRTLLFNLKKNPNMV